MTPSLTYYTFQAILMPNITHTLTKYSPNLLLVQTWPSDLILTSLLVHYNSYDKDEQPSNLPIIIHSSTS